MVAHAPDRSAASHIRHSYTVVRVSDVIWTERPALRSPVLVAAFGGWNDAGDAASAAVEFIGAHHEPRVVARIDADEFIDFTSVRPTVRLVDGQTREIDWPETTVSAVEVPGADGDLAILQGPEPSLRWGRYCRAVVEVATRARRAARSSPWARCWPTCRTRGRCRSRASPPTPPSSTGSASSTPATRGRPASWACCTTRAAPPGLSSVSLWASVPHYVAAAPNPKVALALVRAFEGAAGVVVDATELETAAEDYERQVSAAVASDPEVRAFVERLESAADESEEDADPAEPAVGGRDRQRLPEVPAPAGPREVAR